MRAPLKLCFLYSFQDFVSSERGISNFYPKPKPVKRAKRKKISMQNKKAILWQLILFSFLFLFSEVNADATVFGLNIDFGTVFSEPTSDYGAAAGQDGYWNRAGLDVTALFDTFGFGPGASVNVTADVGTGNIGGPPSSDDEKLLEDNFYSANGNSWSANLSGLASGAYTVFLYAPSHPSVPTGDMTVGGVAVPSIPGNSGSTLIEGTSWVSVQVTVTDGTLMISGAGTSFSGLAGIQVVTAQEVEGMFYLIPNKKGGAAVIYLE